jgi:hypothetical protein
MPDDNAVCARHPYDCSVEKHATEWRDEAIRLRARLAEVEAWADTTECEYCAHAVLAAARGDAQDRAAEGHVWLRPQWVCSRCGIAYAGGNPPCRPQRSGSEDRPA